MKPWLVRAPDHLGDGLMARPCINALAKSHPLVVVAPKWGPVLYPFDGIQHCLPGTRPPSEMAILLKPSFGAAWRHRHYLNRIGIAFQHRKWLLTEALPVIEEHRIDGFNRIALSLGVKAEPIPRFPSVPTETKYDVVEKKILILGAGGVVPSIIFALNKMKVSSITLSNRTKSKAENLKKLFKNLLIVNWGEVPNFDVIINATSLGLNNKDIINLDFSKIEKSKFFYDVIYNPIETNFLKRAKKLGHETENGKKMFIYQAAEAFKIWHGVQPEINEEVRNLLE